MLPSGHRVGLCFPRAICKLNYFEKGVSKPTEVKSIDRNLIYADLGARQSSTRGRGREFTSSGFGAWLVASRYSSGHAL